MFSFCHSRARARVAGKNGFQLYFFFFVIAKGKQCVVINSVEREMKSASDNIIGRFAGLLGKTWAGALNLVYVFFFRLGIFLLKIKKKKKKSFSLMDTIVTAKIDIKSFLLRPLCPNSIYRSLSKIKLRGRKRR